MKSSVTCLTRITRPSLLSDLAGLSIEVCSAVAESEVCRSELCVSIPTCIGRLCEVESDQGPNLQNFVK